MFPSVIRVNKMGDASCPGEEPFRIFRSLCRVGGDEDLSLVMCIDPCGDIPAGGSMASKAKI